MFLSLVVKLLKTMHLPQNTDLKPCYWPQKTSRENTACLIKHFIFDFNDVLIATSFNCWVKLCLLINVITPSSIYQPDSNVSIYIFFFHVNDEEIHFNHHDFISATIIVMCAG